MRETGEITKVAIIKVTCDRCDKVCEPGDCSPLGEFAVLTAHWGYDSQHDMQHYELDICEECFFKLIEDFKRKEFTESL